MSSDHDTESTNIESPLSYLESPYSSPSQNVPELAFSMTELRCSDETPYLQIVEEPQSHFRFRYRSEMVGTHGCLMGESNLNVKPKTHPTVELRNYRGRAVLRCHLAQHETTDEHPHKLLEDDQDRDVSYIVPEHGCYRVGFAGMGIIHTAKKDVPGLLFKKYSDLMNVGLFKEMGLKELRTYCENEAKNVNLNIVRLKFSAHDIDTDQEICRPVFSRPIFNMKCAATNDLKICRISRSCGRACGGDDIFLLVEKVNKKNIMVRFLELDENEETVWSAIGHFIQSDVHHQYAIVLRTPPYKDPNTPVNKKVFIELVRPKDGRTSERKEFQYKAAPVNRANKKRKANSAYTSYSSLEGSLKSTGEVPTTVLHISRDNKEQENILNDVSMYTISQIPQIPKFSPLSTSSLGDALYGVTAEGSPSDIHYYQNPMLPHGVMDPPDLKLTSIELERILRDDPNMSTDDKEKFCNADWSEYLKSYADSLTEENNSFRMDIIRSLLATDSGKGAGSVEFQMDTRPNTIGHHDAIKEMKTNDKDKDEDEKPSISDDKENNEYKEFYKSADGAEVKTLIKEICEMIREKPNFRRQVVREKLERLFKLRLSNGDTFLHMTICSRQPSLDFIVKLIHSMRMPHLLNLINNQSQTILHLAVINNMPEVLPFLISKGCNPMVDDCEGNTVIHVAAMCHHSCLESLLEALKDSDVSYDLNYSNDEKQTALHLAMIHKKPSNIDLLLRNGASYNVRDSAGRTPLHLAAYDDCLSEARVLLDYIAPTEIDAVDGSGYTALQIVCDGEVRQNSIAIVKLLLRKKADPLKHEEWNISAWQLSKNKSQIKEVIRPALPFDFIDDLKSEPEEIKSEPEVDYETADEADTPGGLQSELYPEEFYAELDRTRGWEKLLPRFNLHPGVPIWYNTKQSPSRTLFHYAEESDKNIDPKKLAAILEDIGELEAANIIRRLVQ